jgi:hypothetical protein
VSIRKVCFVFNVLKVILLVALMEIGHCSFLSVWNNEEGSLTPFPSFFTISE